MSELFVPAPAVPARDAVFVRVAVERGIAARGRSSAADEDDPWRGALTYALPPGTPAPSVGQRVLVPLGRGDVSAPGFVVEVGGVDLAGDVPLHRVKAVSHVEEGRLTPALVELARWMASYYVCPLGMVLATMMPSAVKRGTGTVVRRLVACAGPDEAAELLARGELKPSVAKAWSAIAALELRDAIDPRELAGRAGLANLGPVNRLVEAGLLKRVEREEVRARGTLSSQSWAHAPSAPPHSPTPAQSRIADGLAATLGSFAAHLVRGVTGSGKTEVYMRVIARALERGRQGLVLVPEIALTPQTAGRFLDRFGRDAASAVAVLHSGLGASERHAQWIRASSPECRLVVGARSAVFAPLPRLGVIVVDEEHASDYKQDQLPRYHARDVAIKRAQLEGCPVVLGSATPSLESWANVQPPPGGGSPRYRLWELTERVGGGRLPRVEIVDLQAARREGPGEPRPRAAAPRGEARSEPASAASHALASITPRLRRALIETLREGGQAILLLNRRGFASYLGCPSPSCGWSLRCGDCDAGMVLHVRPRESPAGEGAGARHAVAGLVRCHHCLAEQLVPRVCPVCARPVLRLGAGTQRLEDELHAALQGGRGGGHDGGLDEPLPPGAIARVDGDTMASARDYFDVLGRFGRGEIRVLLGTQMIAKGHDFPNVRLVGVVNADTGLSLPDFRAAERTFQLVSQVAGRAGRGKKPGVVIVQTMNPREPAIVLASRHDYAAFAARELAIRKRAALPPTTRMARIVVRDRDLPKAEARARALADELKAVAGPGCTVLGPAPAPLSRLATFWRVGLEIIAPRATELHAMLEALARRGLLTSDARTAVDVDPIALL